MKERKQQENRKHDIEGRREGGGAGGQNKQTFASETPLRRKRQKCEPSSSGWGSPNTAGLEPVAGSFKTWEATC
eukprot:2773164-Pyramimonas_sp.AAC.1